jgi:hypothetical protein
MVSSGVALTTSGLLMVLDLELMLRPLELMSVLKSGWALEPTL